MVEQKIILLLSGEIASGKTTLSHLLQETFDFKICKTRDALIELGKKHLKGKPSSRDFLQKFGKSLDDKEEGRWVLDVFQDQFGFEFQKSNLFIIDAVRKLSQINYFRKAYGYSVFHIHLTASKGCLKERFLNREEVSHLTKDEAIKKYHAAKNDSTEKDVNSMADDADLVIDTENCSKDGVKIRVAGFLKLLSLTANELVDVLIGGQFGSEGKGQIAAHISREYDCLIRVGGPNAGHTVYEEPKKHVFHMLPSGCWRNQHAKLILGPGAVINEENLMKEIAEYHVADEFTNRLLIDENAILISKKDISEEQKLLAHIGSTGQGVGIATANNLIHRLKESDKHKAKHSKLLKPFIGNSFNVIETMYRENKKILLEGTQGTGLSIHHGIYPYVTSRDTTVSGCLAEAGIAPKRVRKIIMVARTYPIRVGGNSGPFLSKEINWQIVAERSGIDVEELQQKEKTTTTKKDRRVAEFSWELFRKACELNSPTDIALTFVDYLNKSNKLKRGYDQLTIETRQLIEELERCSGVKVSLLSTGFDYRAIIDRRNWK